MDWKLYFFKLIFMTYYGIFISIANPISKTNRSIPLSEFSNSSYKYTVMQMAKAAEMTNFMDESVEPCTDFYQFSCGRWSKINEAKNVPTTGFFENLSGGFSKKVASILNGTNDPNDTEVDRAIKRFFKSCMKLYDVPLNEHKWELTEIIDQYGKMPALVGDSWNEADFNWLEVIAKIQHDLGLQIIIGTDIMADFKDNSQNRIYLGQAVLVLESKSMYVDSSNEVYRKLYIKKIKDQLQQHLQMPIEKAQKIAKEIVDFEISLGRGMKDDHVSQSLDESSILTNAEQITRKYAPTIDFRKYLTISFGEDITVPFYEYEEQYQKNLKEVIETTPKITLANYIFYKLVSEFFPKVSKELKEQHELCKGVVSKHFAKNLDNIIYRRYNNKDTERDVNVIWQKIKDAFRNELNSPKLDWISWQTRATALKKLDAMTLEINSYLETNFTKDFGDLIIDNTNYISNLKNIFRHSAQKSIAKLHEAPEPYEAGEDLSYTPANVILENKIKIPVSLLQPNYLWGDNYPAALKFGTLGFLIGHELIHGFDDSGREYDENGNQRDWWDQRSKEAFIRRTECFKEQYHEYIFGGRNLPLSEAQSENIADNGGLKIAYDAYLEWLEEAERAGKDLSSETLVNMKYTHKQLFFISFAQIWCSDTHPSMIGLQTSTDEHTPGIYRVIGVLSNFEDFAKEFNCPIYSDMVPKKRCEVY